MSRACWGGTLLTHCSVAWRESSGRMPQPFSSMPLTSCMSCSLVEHAWKPEGRRLVELVHTDPLPPGSKEEKDLEGSKLDQKRMRQESSNTKAEAGQIVNGTSVIAHGDVSPAGNSTHNPLPTSPEYLVLVRTILQLFGF